MIQGKTYVRQNEEGAFRIGDLDVSLDSVVIAYQQGFSPETIQQLYPALTIEEVYGAITFYLANRDAIDRYLDKQNGRWQNLREASTNAPSPVVARLRALSANTKSATP